MSDLGGGRRFAWLLGVVAALAVVGTSTAAVVVDHDRGRFEVRAGTQSVRVPEHGWVKQSQPVGYLGRDGQPLVGVSGGAVYDVGWCPADRSYNHAIVGFVPRGDRAIAEIARDWGAAITLDPRTGKHAGPVRLTFRGADRVDADLTSPSGLCNPPRVHLSVVSAGRSALVLVRDLDLDDVLTPHDADEILDSLTSR